MDESQEYYAGFDAAFAGNANASDDYSGQAQADYCCGYIDGQHERAWQLQNPYSGAIEFWGIR